MPVSRRIDLVDRASAPEGHPAVRRAAAWALASGKLGSTQLLPRVVRLLSTLYDIGHQDGVDYLVMEHLEGTTSPPRTRSPSWSASA